VNLLFEENLSPILTQRLADCYNGCQHVRDFGLKASPGIEVWGYAARNAFVTVTKDSDFPHRSSLQGHPPKVIWVALGNCSTSAVEELLRRCIREVREFLADSEKAFLVLS
jgi:predicted nuclease of predicted toxin-antitoxin system